GRGGPVVACSQRYMPSGFQQVEPHGPCPNIAGLQMSLSYDFDHHGHLVPKSSLFKLTEPKPEAPKLRVVPTQSESAPTKSAPVSHPAPLGGPLAPQPKPSDLKLDRSRDALLTNFGKQTLTDRYLLEGESFQDMFARVACAYADDVAHAQRIYDAISKVWF